LLLVRTTPLANALPEPLSHMATPLLGWPEHGFRAAWWGLELPDGLVEVLCILRTAGALLFALGVQTRVAGVVAAAAALAVLSQNAFAFSFTLYTLFVGTAVVAASGAGRSLALRPEPAAGGAPTPWLVWSFVNSVYAWSAIAKVRVAWLSGRTLHALHEAGFLSGSLADTLFATPDRCRLAAWAVVLVEASLGPLLVFRRTRMGALVVALTMHATFEWTAHPDVLSWVMAALLVSFLGNGKMTIAPRAIPPESRLP
jgi:hypothetical protein